MDLVVFGDSWTYGDELVPDTPEYRNKVNIGGLVYRDYNFENYHNYSANGGSLQHIIVHILKYLNSSNYSTDNLILVGLTTPLRKLRFSNIAKKPLNWASHKYEQYITHCDDSLKESDIFKLWWESEVYCNVNVRNDLIYYFNSINTIKSLLSEHSKYIVWQSIDGGLYDKVETDFEEIISDYENQNSKDTDHEFFDLFFNKTFVKNQISKNTKDSQLWINFDELSWRDWIFSQNDDKMFIEGRNHPSEYGISEWYSKILKKYIDKILDN